MDNCAVTTDCIDELHWASGQLKGIFEPYGFKLQQFITNCSNLQSELDAEYERETNITNKLMGVQWNRENDTLFTKNINLDLNARSKRQVLSAVASQYDLFGYNLPIMNRCKLFLHNLQCRQDLSWDDALPDSDVKAWHNICKQVNSVKPFEIPRVCGRRTDKYNLIAFSDSSKDIFGIVIYCYNIITEDLSFLFAKNKIVSKQLEGKSIPSLELQAVSLAADCLVDLYKELSGELCICPIEIDALVLYTDSLIALQWIQAYNHKFDKMRGKSPFVLNRIEHINKICEEHSITFKFVSGVENPADFTTRVMSYNSLIKTNFYTGPEFVKSSNNITTLSDDILEVVVPNPLVLSSASVRVESVEDLEPKGCILNLDRFKSFSTVVKVMNFVFEFINKLKYKLSQRSTDFKHLHCQPLDFNFYNVSFKYILNIDQYEHFKDILDYFKLKNPNVKDMPNIIAQLNVYPDKEGILRVKSKCDKILRISRYNRSKFPVLISKQSKLANLIVHDVHIKMSHAGCYSVLHQVRREFWIPHIFSVVKKYLRRCITCKRFNARTIQLNQNAYREIRLEPSCVPFRHLYLDFMGPFNIYNNKVKSKVWILILTCMWSRGVNLKVCQDQSTPEFLRSLQLHCFEHGVPEICITDLGSQLTAGSNITRNFLKDYETEQYFKSFDCKTLTFEHYYKGHSQLGALVEVLVKTSKRLLFGAIGKNILELRQFEFIVCKTVHLINKRPVAYQASLRGDTGNDVPSAITPELLMHGYDLPSINLIPQLQAEETDNWDEPIEQIRNSYSKLQKVRTKLISLYNEEFLNTLICQAVDKKDRFRPVKHEKIEKGDVVLIKENFCKASDYPMAVVEDVVINDLGEVTGATLKKGKTGEITKRHSSNIIPLLKLENDLASKDNDSVSNNDSVVCKPKRHKRKAAIKSAEKTKKLLSD